MVMEYKVDEATGLSVQDLSQLDATELTPLDPTVMSRQATLNIGA
jgi:hypothetical protein